MSDTNEPYVIPIPWRCFHCDEVFTDAAEAREHFGFTKTKTPACRLSSADVTLLRTLEADIAEICRQNATLENDARLWHESQADRVRRIGDREWWQELDFREGEKLVLAQALETAQRDMTTAAQALNKANGSAALDLDVFPTVLAMLRAERNGLRELAEESLRIVQFMTSRQKNNLLPDWYVPRLKALLAATAPSK